jgi:hypothetical protein
MKIVWRIIAIILKPRETWLEIKSEQIPVRTLFAAYASIIAIVPAAAGFIKMSLLGTTVLGIHFRVPFVSGLIHACFSYVLGLAGLFIMSFVIHSLAPSFDSRKDLDSAAKLAVFSITPAWIGEILVMVPHLGFIRFLIALYSLVLLYLGLPVLLDTPGDKFMMYFIVILLISFVIFPLSTSFQACFSLHCR